MRVIGRSTALSSLLIGGLIWAGNVGLLPIPDYSETITQWIAFTAVIGWGGSLTYFTIALIYQVLIDRQRFVNTLQARLPAVVRSMISNLHYIQNQAKPVSFC
ncbi:MAG: hypothetical protein AB1585_04290 [Thermodesulfobacteriota bacterium]